MFRLLLEYSIQRQVTRSDWMTPPQRGRCPEMPLMRPWRSPLQMAMPLEAMPPRSPRSADSPGMLPLPVNRRLRVYRQKGNRRQAMQ